MTATLSLGRRNELLSRARELWAAWDLRGLELLLRSLPEDQLLAEPELGYRLCAVLTRLQEYEEAVVLTRKLVRAVRRAGNDRIHRWLINNEGIAFLFQGRLEDAEQRFLSALARSNSAEDFAGIATSTVNLGSVAAIRCEWDEALAACSRTLVACQRTGDVATLAAGHHNLAMAYRQMGFFRAADAQFEQALQLNRSRNSLAALENDIERALLFHQMGDSRLAEATIRRTLMMVREHGLPREEAESLRVLGVVVAGRAPAEARDAFDRSMALAREAQNRLLEAELLEERAALDAAAGDAASAGALAASAEAAYRALGAERRAERVGERLARPG